jgi:hypothetical protein
MVLACNPSVKDHHTRVICLKLSWINSSKRIRMPKGMFPNKVSGRQVLQVVLGSRLYSVLRHPTFHVRGRKCSLHNYVPSKQRIDKLNDRELNHPIKCLSSEMSTMPQNVLIIGATGVIGQYITAAIVSAKSSFGRISILTSPKTIAEKVEEIATLESNGVQIKSGSLDDEASVKAAYNGKFF